jgi:glutathionylspermidine synthase
MQQQLALVFAQLDTFNDNVLEEAINAHALLAVGDGHLYNTDALLDALNEAYEEDVQMVGKSRAKTALARTALLKAVDDIAEDEGNAHTLAQAIQQRYYALEQLLN